MDFTLLTSFLNQLDGVCAPGVDCKIYYKHKEVYRHSAGYWDIEQKIPVQEDAAYYIYSATKPLTCTAAMILYEKGCFLLSEPLYEYIPEYKDMWVKHINNNGEIIIERAQNPIRIVDLFTMSAGFSYSLEYEAIKRIREQTNGRCPTLEVVRTLAEEPLEFEPGTHFKYSLCHDILGGLIEVISGKTLGAFMKENIFSPLEMNHTGFFQTENGGVLKNKMAAKYQWNVLTQKPERSESACRFQLGTEYESGGAGLISTVDDMATFAECLCNNGNAQSGENIISKATIDLMRKNHLDEIRLADFRAGNQQHRIGYGYGLGVRTMIDPMAGGSNGSIGEFGWPGALGSYLLIDPDRELAVFFAQHMIGNMDILRKIHPKLRNVIYACLDK